MRKFMQNTAASAVILTLTAATMGSITQDHDYTAFPPTLAEAAEQVAAVTVSMADAIAKAEETTGGTATGVSLDFAADQPAYIVITRSEDAVREITIDASTGDVTDDAITVSGELQKTESGLMYYDTVVGDGQQPAGPSSTVKVHYTGMFNNGEVFDSSVERGEPIEFRLDGVIRGWTEGVGSMKVGGKRRLIIPYQLAYGEQGRRGAIPPRATLIFDVELLDVRNN